MQYINCSLQTELLFTNFFYEFCVSCLYQGQFLKFCFLLDLTVSCNILLLVHRQKRCLLTSLIEDV